MSHTPETDTCPACSAWRDKWLSTRRYLRAANRGAETNSLALQLCAARNLKLANELSEARDEARASMDGLKRALDKAMTENLALRDLADADRLGSGSTVR